MRFEWGSKPSLNLLGIILEIENAGNMAYFKTFHDGSKEQNGHFSTIPGVHFTPFDNLTHLPLAGSRCGPYIQHLSARVASYGT